jgi:hypothetical protein
MKGDTTKELNVTTDDTNHQPIQDDAMQPLPLPPAENLPDAQQVDVPVPAVVHADADSQEFTRMFPNSIRVAGMKHIADNCLGSALTSMQGHLGVHISFVV